MVQAESLAVPGEVSALAAAERGMRPPKSDGPSKGWLTAGMGAFVVAVLAGSGWIFFESSQLAQGGGLNDISHWPLKITLAVAGGGAVLALVTWGVFQLRERGWEKKLHSNLAEWESFTTRLQTQVAEKATVEEHLSQMRQKLEQQVAELTRANTTMLAELTQRKETEKSLAQQRLELTRSKGVLEVHVQARSQELQKLQKQYELILNAAGEGICGLEAGGRISFINPTAARLMGFTVAEMVGRNEADFFGALAQEELITGRLADDTHPREISLSRRDGTTFEAEYVRTPISDNGRVIGRVLMFKDITERKQTAEALTIKAAELTRSNAELEQFAFVASHDLQEPLRKIRAFGDRLKVKCETAIAGEGLDYLERMQSAAARMQTLINALLTFSRVISSMEPFEMVDLHQVTREVLSDLEVSIEKAGAKVEVGELPTIEADPVQMRQLVQNLIGNALKFQAPGAKPVVRIHAQVVAEPGPGHTAFLSRLQAAGGLPAGDTRICHLRVEDNGIGFEEKYLDRIFAVFQRLHGRQEYEGTGIGLAVVRRIVDRHKGMITARSKPGEGATFIVTLPARQPGKTKAAA